MASALLCSDCCLQVRRFHRGTDVPNTPSSTYPAKKIFLCVCMTEADLPPTLCSLPTDSLELIVLQLRSYADVCALCRASKVFWHISKLVRERQKTLLETTKFIQQRYGNWNRRTMEKIGLIAHTKRIDHNIVKKGIEAWDHTPIQWKTRLAVPFGYYTTNKVLHVNPYTSEPEFMVIALTVKSVIELLWMPNIMKV